MMPCSLGDFVAVYSQIEVYTGLMVFKLLA